MGQFESSQLPTTLKRFRVTLLSLVERAQQHLTEVEAWGKVQVTSGSDPKPHSESRHAEKHYPRDKNREVRVAPVMFVAVRITARRIALS